VKGLAVAVLVVAGLALPAAAPGKPDARSEAQVGTTHVTQEINVIGGDLLHWIHVSDPTGAPPFCVTFRLERRVKGAWRGLGEGSDRRSRECCPREDETDDGCYRDPANAYWDSFVYPQGKLRKEFLAGKLRVRAIPSLGPDLALRR